MGGHVFTNIDLSKEIKGNSLECWSWLPILFKSMSVSFIMEMTLFMYECRLRGQPGRSEQQPCPP